MTPNNPVAPLQQLLEAGFPPEQIVFEAKKHLAAIRDLPEDTDGRDEAIQAIEYFVNNLPDC